MLKFRSKDSDIDECYKILKIAIKNEDYLKSYRKVENEKILSNKSNEVGGTGMRNINNNEEKISEMMKNQMNKNMNLISTSFNDIESLKMNLQPMVLLRIMKG